MAYKVAVASSDGKVINQHFGRSKVFIIFEVDNDEWAFQENRANTPPCGFGDHSEDAMQRTIDLVSDCSIVLISKIGPVAEQKLNSKGIKAYMMPVLIPNALNKLIAFDQRQRKLFENKG